MAQRSYCWTHFSGEEITEYPPYLRYCVYQIESCPETGKLHRQGYAEFTKKLTPKLFQSWLPGAHVEKRSGTREQARAYCMKADSRVSGPFEHGDWTLGGQGKRPDLASAVETIVSCTSVKEAMEQVAVLHPVEYVKFGAGLEKLARKRIKMSELDIDLREWQEKLMEDMAVRDDRAIHWVYDPVGGAGKSTFARWLVCNHGAILLSGKVHDMAYAYDGEPYALFDLSRTKEGKIDHIYEFAEMLKNGIIFSAKYDSCMKTFPFPHVIIFSNSMPEEGKWSADRLRLTDLSSRNL